MPIQIRNKGIIKGADMMEAANIKSTHRNNGVDLLRIASMIMIVMLHTLGRSNLLTKTVPLSLKYEIAWFIEIACYCAVNCFILISGYVGINSRFRLSRIIALWTQVAFYSVVLEVVYQFICGILDIQALVYSLFPLLTNEYWFFTQYLVLCFLMPFLNKMIKSLNNQQQTLLTGVVLIFFSVLPFLYYSPLPLVGNKKDVFFTGRGYSILWFIVLYICGSTIKNLEKRNILQLKSIWLSSCYFICVLLTWLIHYACKRHIKPLSDLFAVSYTSPLIVLAAISLLLLFSNLRFNIRMQRFITFWSPGAFGVYLIHSNPRVYILYVKACTYFMDMKVLQLIPSLIITVALVYFICALADILRAYFFSFFRLNKLFSMVDKSWFNQLWES